MKERGIEDAKFCFDRYSGIAIKIYIVEAEVDKLVKEHFAIHRVELAD